MIDYNRYIVELQSSAQYGRSGSGVIYFPKGSDAGIIITAKHVMVNSSLDEITICNIQKTDGSFEEIEFEGRGDIGNIYYSLSHDLALIELPISLLRDITGDLPQLPSVDRRFDFEYCQSLGYPEANDGEIKLLRSEFRATNALDIYLVEATTAHHEDLVTKYADAIDNVRGMSGGAFFYTDGTKNFFAGVTSKFQNEYKDFVSVDLVAVNEFLTHLGIPPLEFTFGSREGLDTDWFKNHIESSCESLKPRYTPEVNLDVPQGDYFKYLTQGQQLRVDVKKTLHGILKSINKRIYIINKKHSKDIYEYVDHIVSSIRSFYRLSSLKIDGNYRHSKFLNLLEKSISTLEGLNQKLEQESFKIYREEEKNKTTHGYFDRDPYREEINKTRDVISDLYRLRNYLSSKKVKLIFEKTLLLNGDAGTGKSHLLGDMSAARNSLELPTILLLGNHLQETTNPRGQLLDQLGLMGQYSFKELLTQLNETGRFIGERVLFMIDALNEGPMRFHWNGYIADLIAEFKKYPYLGFVFSIRSGYEEDVLPSNLIEYKPYIEVTHHGFKQNPLLAIKHFCSYFNLNAPSVPILTPEFTNPQFLLLTCQTLQKTGATEFPKGLGGINTIYENYTRATSKKIIDNINKLGGQNIDIPKSCNLVEDGIFHLLQLGYKLNYNANEVKKHFASFMTYTPSLNGIAILQQLITEHILTEKIIRYQGKRESFYEFNYEMYAQHVCVAKTLNDAEDDLKSLLKKRGLIYELCDKYLSDRKLLTVIAIQLPEKHNIELYELITEEWLAQLEGDAKSKFVHIQFIALESTLWRDTSSIDSKKCKSFVYRLLLDHKGDHDILNTLITLACVEDHPLNADFLHDYMMSMSMAERDEFWAEFTYESFSESKNMSSRLIDWILDYSDYKALSTKASELALITLTWFTASTFTPLRDSATIAIVKVLGLDLSNGLFLIKKFKDIDDYYLLERIICAIYGASLRSDDLKSLKELASFFYSEYFNSKIAPIHFTIRDYARGIIEYYVEKTESAEFDLTIVKPPYNSTIPFVHKDFEDVKSKFYVEVHPELNDFEKSRVWANNNITSHYDSGYDYSDSRIYKTIEDFYCLSFTLEEKYGAILERLSSKCRATLEKQKQLIFDIGEADDKVKEGYYTPKQYELLETRKEATIEDKSIIEQQKDDYKSKWEQKKKDSESEYDKLKTKLTRISKILCWKEYTNYVLPYFESLRYTTSNYVPRLNANNYRSWLVERIYHLGFDSEKHSYFDADYGGGTFRRAKHQKYNGILLRISEKYRQIANMELLARIADNYQFFDEYEEPKFRKFDYQGQEIDFRDIDPSIMLYGSNSDNKTDSNTFLEYGEWHLEDWLKRIDDLPKLSTLISHKLIDKQWFLLRSQINFKHIPELGNDDYSKGAMDLDIWIHSFLVTNSDRVKTVEHYKNLGFNDDQDITSHDYYTLFDKEFYQTKKYSLFSDIAKREIDYKPVYGHPLYDYYSPSGGYNEFQSGISVVKPSKYLAEQLKLKHSQFEGEMMDEDDEVVVKSFLNIEWTNLFITKDKLLTLLKDNDCSIIWHIRGRKLITGGNSSYPQTHILATMSMDSSGEIKIEEDYRIDNMYHTNL